MVRRLYRSMRLRAPRIAKSEKRTKPRAEVYHPVPLANQTIPRNSLWYYRKKEKEEKEDEGKIRIPPGTSPHNAPR